MSTSPEQALERILADLQSEEAADQLAGLRDLERANYSSQAILLRLEVLAIHGTAAVRMAALDALDSRVSQYVRSQRQKHLNASQRLTILAEAKEWAERGLIEQELAEVLIRRYDLSRKPLESAAVPVAETAKPPSAAARDKPAPATPAKPTPAPTPTPAAPALTLSERLLSQTSINIALYLGAFLVVGAAVILAALVEATRLPILLGATALFGGGAIAAKRRLPQPSFILAMVFSFLLPISANVLVDSLHLSSQGRDAYWTAVYLGMALIWCAGTRLYASRLFSLAAFIAWGFGVQRLGQLLPLSDSWNAMGFVVASLGGLLGVHLLQAWKDRKFALPLFLAAQALGAGAMLWTVSDTVNKLSSSGPAAPQVGLAAALTLTAGAAFYAWSALQYAFPPFSWGAVACLLPVSLLFLRSFDASARTQSLGSWTWGTLFALAAELLRRRTAARDYHWPFSLGSLVLFACAVTGAFLANLQDDVPLADALSIALGAAAVCTIVTILRPRVFMWFAALAFALIAYFTFFALPLIEPLDVYGGYQLLGSSLLLLLPELFFKSPFTLKDTWRWPPFCLGAVMTAINIAGLVFAGEAHAEARAIVMGAYALLFAAYALHMRRPRVGYLATASAALATTYALQRFGLDLKMSVLTGLALAFFVGGYFVRGEKTQPWGSVLRLSGLALGAVITATGLANADVWAGLRSSTLGFDVLVISILFFAEAYVRPGAPIEAGGPLFASLAAYLIMRRFGVTDLPWHLLAFSLIWLGADIVFSRTLKSRHLEIATRAVGGLLALANLPALLYDGYQAGHPADAAIVFVVYAVFFAASAWSYRQPLISFAATAALAFAALLTLEHLHRDLWPAVLTGLAVVYFAAGYILRRGHTIAWGSALRISGLAVGAAVAGAAVILLKENVAPYVLLIGGLYFAETYVRGEGRLEIAGPAFFSAGAFLGLRDLEVTDDPYLLLAISVLWLAADLFYARTLQSRPWAAVTRYTGGAIAAGNALALLSSPAGSEPRIAAICFGTYAAFLALYAWLRSEPRLGYLSTAALPLSAFFLLKTLRQDNWLYAIGLIALLYYAAGYLLRRRDVQGWGRMLLLSGLMLGVLNSVSAPIRGGLDSAIPVALAATLFAVEAFDRRNVWLAFPANALYLGSYFLILMSLEVDQPQFFSMGAALLGMLMHYLLSRSGSKSGAFLAGMFSQLVLLGTTFIQLLSTEELAYFMLIFFQGLAVLVYGIVVRSRSLVIAPIVFIVVSVIAVIYTALKGIGTVVLIGGAGIILLLLGILAVILRERIAKIGESLSEWQA